jgi:hypothetical protein
VIKDNACYVVVQLLYMSILQVEAGKWTPIKMTNAFCISIGVQWKILRDHTEEIDEAVKDYA